MKTSGSMDPAVLKLTVRLLLKQVAIGEVCGRVLESLREGKPLEAGELSQSLTELLADMEIFEDPSEDTSSISFEKAERLKDCLRLSFSGGNFSARVLQKVLNSSSVSTVEERGRT